MGLCSESRAPLYILMFVMLEGKMLMQRSMLILCLYTGSAMSGIIHNHLYEMIKHDDFDA